MDLDPHAGNEGQTISIQWAIFEGLLRRSSDLSLHPALAESWSQPNATTWRFRLRQGVKFHDGTPFTADDVVFSVRRALHKNAAMRIYVESVKEVVKVDDHTVDLLTDGPDPVLLQKLPLFFIMSARWAEQHRALEPGPKVATESPTARQANGTGPFRLVERVPDTRIVLEANPEWWGNRTKRHNLTRVEYRPMANAATRVASLLAGEVDLIEAVPPQDVARIKGAPGVRVVQGPELRTIYLGFDQWRDELLDMPGSKRNPFKDVRVRRAVYQAIDVDAIHSKVMRGSSRVAALLVGPGIQGYDARLDVRYPYDPEAARKLLAEAGYPQGFPVTLDCTNDRYMNDEAICQSLVPMLARVGVKVSLNAQTKNKIFPKILAGDTSFYMGGWSSTTYDAHYTLASLALPPPPGSKSSWNCGRYTHPRIEALSRAAAVEMDSEKRLRLLTEALGVTKEDFGYAPLHQQTALWAMRDNVEVQLPPDALMRQFEVRMVK